MDLNQKKAFVIDFLYYLLWLFIFYFLFKVAAVYLFPFLIGIIIAYIVQSPACIISKKIKLNKKICAAILSVLFYIVFFLLLFFIVWVLYSQSQKLIKSISNDVNLAKIFEDNFWQFLNKLDKIDTNKVISLKKIISETANDFVEKISFNISNLFTSLIKKAPTFFISFVITIVSTCYISKDFERLYQFFKGFVSENILRKVVKIKNIVIESFKGITIGYFLMFLLTFMELIIGFLLLNISNVFLIAFVISLIDLLPVLGTGIILIPWAVFEMIKNDYNKGIGILVLYLIIVIIRNFVEPKIIGKQIGINPLFTLVFIFLGLKIGGIVGMITLPMFLSVCFNYFRQQFYINEEKV